MKLFSRVIVYGELFLSLFVGVFFLCVFIFSVRMFFVGLFNKISVRVFYNILVNLLDYIYELILYVLEE